MQVKDNPCCVDFKGTAHEGNAYVYVWDDAVGTPIYVGSGTGNRGMSISGHRSNAISCQLDRVHSITFVARNIDRQYAYDIEYHTIKYFVRNKIPLLQSVYVNGDRYGLVLNDTEAMRLLQGSWLSVLHDYYLYIQATQGCEALSVDIQYLHEKYKREQNLKWWNDCVVKPYSELYKAWERGEITAEEGCRRLGISISTWNSRKKKSWWHVT